ncbi:hypothetical protein AB0M34_04585 [Nocardia sp. NPDC050193]
MGGPERIDVYRSSQVEDQDALHRPVADYIRTHGLVLAVHDERRDEDMMGNSAEYMVFVPPRVRNDVLAGTGVSLPWIPGGYLTESGIIDPAG